MVKMSSRRSSQASASWAGVMCRHAGWITAACGLAAENAGEPPHILLFPEVPFAPERFLARVDACVRQYGYCTVAVSEGLSDAAGNLIAGSGSKDAFGHAQLGGVGQMVAELIKDKLGYKYHWALADYLQRSARHLASRTDLEQAHALGVAAIDLALQGKNAVMATIQRLADAPYGWEIGDAPLAEIANVERKMPPEFIAADGFHITDACRSYLQPLIEGEEPPPYRNGLPDYVRLKNISVPKKLEAFAV